MATRHVFHCPICEHRARILETRVAPDGGRRRRLECQRVSCRHRWTVKQEPLVPLPPRPRRPRRPPSGERAPLPPLTDEQLLMLLDRSDLTHAQAGKLCGGRSREMVRQIRFGIAYADRLPDVPRWGDSRKRKVTCEDCDQWLGYCTLGHPDPIEEGLTVANWCTDFLARPSRIAA